MPLLVVPHVSLQRAPPLIASSARSSTAGVRATIRSAGEICERSPDAVDEASVPAIHCSSMERSDGGHLYGGPGRRATRKVPVEPTRAPGGASSIVVGVDGSPRSRDALALAATLAEPEQHILLAHVSAYRNGDARSLIRDVVDATFGASRELLDPAIKREMRLVDTVSVSAGLNELASSTAAAQLVVGSSRGKRVGRRAGSSVAEALLSRSRVPVAVAPHGYGNANGVLGVIGCAVDGSPPSLEALAWAARLARRRRAPLRSSQSTRRSRSAVCRPPVHSAIDRRPRTLNVTLRHRFGWRPRRMVWSPSGSFSTETP